MQVPIDITDHQLQVVNTFLHYCEILGMEGHSVEDIVLGMNLATASYLEQVMTSLNEGDDDEPATPI